MTEAHYCSQCGKHQDQVATLIALVGSAFVCDECVELMHDIVKRKRSVRSGIGAGLADELRERVAKETRRALRDHEDQLTAIVRAAVSDAIATLFNEERA